MPKVARPGRPSRTAPGIAGLFGALLVHGGLLLLVLTAKPRSLAVEPAEPVELTVVEREAPKPPPPPEPQEKEPEPPPKLLRPKPKNLPVPPREAPPPVKEDLPPPPNDDPPKDAKPQAPVTIGISMSSTTTAGGFAAPVGNSLYGSAPRVATRPEDVAPYASPNGRYVPPHQVTELPVLLTEVRPAYPEEARKLGLEGQVIVRVTVDASGKVASAKIIKGIGHGFDESALEAIKRDRFKPGTYGGEAITTEITYTMTFVID